MDTLCYFLRYKKEVRHYHFLMGMIELKTKNYSEAIDSFKLAVSLLPHPSGFITDDGLYLYYLALAYHESGDLRAARDAFEGLVGFIPGRNAYGDLYAESYYRLGQIYEQQGNSSKAIENTRNSSLSGRTPAPASLKLRMRRRGSKPCDKYGVVSRPGNTK